jgi:alpha-L-rhamnosidase
MKTSFCLVLGVAAVVSAGAASVRVENLQCEYLTNPLGIDVAQPRLSWVLAGSARGQKQTACQILAASSEDLLLRDQGDLWDTGRILSDQSIQVPYLGKQLPSRQRCFWKVRVWDKDGTPSAYSAPAFFEMGLLAPADWHGQWIAQTTDTNSAPAPLLRRAFALDGKVRRARVYICGLGYYELHINGAKIGDHILDPAFTRYDKRALYVAYDVTQALRQGSNAVAVILGNGWYNVQTRAVWNFDQAPWRAAPKLLLELDILFADGREEIIASDGRWKAGMGPITFDSIYGGENYDARLEVPGWDTAAFDDSTWPAAVIAPPPGGRLAAQMMPPIQVDRTLASKKVSEPKPGIFVYDFGQNMAGFARLNISGPAGTKITMKYGERLTPDGLVDQAVIAQHVKRMDARQQFQTDNYILSGKGAETWHSRFDYDGFQYVEVSGAPGRLGPDNLTACFIHSAVQPAGHFECSDPLINRIWAAGLWSYLSNLQGIPTDCPHREKNGWTGDAQLAAEQALFNFAPAAVYTKWINDLCDEQQPSGELPGIVPTSGWGYQWGNGPPWDSALALIPYYLYLYEGDTRILASHFESLRRYVDFLTGKAREGIVDWGLGDWAPAKTETPVNITSTGYYYRDIRLLALAARLAGRDAEAAKFSQLGDQVQEEFNRKFFHADAASYGNGSQTSLSCALYQGLVRPRDRAAVLSNLVAGVRARDNHIDTGILGAKYLLAALTDGGRADVAWQIASQRTAPGWGWWIGQGATTLWEQWNGDDSRNHIMYGDILAWFYKALAGINPDPSAPGFKHFILKPHVVGNLTWVRAWHDCPFGRIEARWRLEGGRLFFDATIPPNTTATVMLPCADPAALEESGHAATPAVPGIKSLTASQGWTKMEVDSGVYRFSLPPPRS